jgi:alkylation response protein AidB-like acyl-CoA dehydrogenase
MATVAPESAMDGLDPMFNPEWFLTEEQLGLLERLREICAETIRPLAAENDRTLTFPRKSLEALGPDGFLGLMLPKEWGGLGQNHVMYAATTETIARYGDASCAMCYVMHIGAVEALKLRATDYTIEKYLSKVRGGLLGTLSYSDPETGSHFWYPIASGARRTDGGFEVLKKASWTTSAGFADFYVLQTTSPDYNGDYSNLSVFVVDAADIQAKPEEWDAMGLRGNQSGSLLLDWKFVPEQQLVGPVGDGANSNDETVDPNFLIGSSGTWNGISLGAIDIAIRHTTRKTHKDVGLRVCDYPTIQDAVGEAIMDTNASRAMVYSVAQALDKVTDGSQTNPAVGDLARGNYLHWLWQIKFEAAKNVAKVVDKMLHCCGGTGYKKQPLQLERYLRDAKLTEIGEGTSEIQRLVIARKLLDLRVV